MYTEELNLIKSVTITFSIFAVGLMGFYFFWKLIHRKLILWSRKTASSMNDQIVEVIRHPARLLFLGLSLGMSLHLAPLISSLQIPLLLLTKLILVISLIWASERLLNVVLLSKLLPTALSESSQTLFRSLSKVFVYSIGFLIILDTLGVSITPLLASLGVGSVAVALAAQDTLSNLFSGFYILIDKPFRVGDCIKINDGSAEGVVSKIGWRSTHIRLYANSIAVIPNSKIASSMVTNFDLPESDSSVSINASTAYTSDLNRIEQIVLEVAFLIQNTLPFASKQQAPSMSYTAFGEFAIHFTVTLKAKRITDGGAMKHEFIKALHARFQNEGITIPYPHYNIQNLSTSLSKFDTM